MFKPCVFYIRNVCFTTLSDSVLLQQCIWLVHVYDITVPCRVVYSASVEVYDHVDAFPSYYFFNGLLLLLQVLHIIWTYMIARIALQKLFHNKVRDVDKIIRYEFFVVGQLMFASDIC